MPFAQSSKTSDITSARTIVSFASGSTMKLRWSKSSSMSSSQLITLLTDPLMMWFPDIVVMRTRLPWDASMLTNTPLLASVGCSAARPSHT